jgi:hypothetical protein
VRREAMPSPALMHSLQNSIHHGQEKKHCGDQTWRTSFGKHSAA